jgi:hypothetical protein
MCAGMYFGCQAHADRTTVAKSVFRGRQPSSALALAASLMNTAGSPPRCRIWSPSLVLPWDDVQQACSAIWVMMTPKAHACLADTKCSGKFMEPLRIMCIPTARGCPAPLGFATGKWPIAHRQLQCSIQPSLCSVAAYHNMCYRALRLVSSTRVAKTR